MKNKQHWLDLAESIDAHRVIPKLIVLMIAIGYAWFAIDSYQWIKEIYETTKDVPVPVAGFVGGTMSALGTVLMLVINKYFDGGRDWSKDDKKED